MDTLLAILGGVLIVVLAYLKHVLEDSAVTKQKLADEEQNNAKNKEIINVLSAEPISTSDSLRKGEF